jgi:hypothetical protein
LLLRCSRGRCRALLAEWALEVTKLRKLCNKPTSLAALPLASSLLELELTSVLCERSPRRLCPSHEDQCGFSVALHWLP